MSRGELLDGPERRRRWGEDEKAAIVAETLCAGVKVADVARRHGVSRALIYRWRRAVGVPLNGDDAGALPALVPVVMTDASGKPEPPAGGTPRAGRGPSRLASSVEIQLPGEIRITVRGCVEDRVLRAVLSALRSS